MWVVLPGRMVINFIWKWGGEKLLKSKIHEDFGGGDGWQKEDWEFLMDLPAESSLDGLWFLSLRRDTWG